MPSFNISAAAKAAGVDRSTMHRAIKSGRISATRDSRGRQRVDLVELRRVFGDDVGKADARATVQQPQQQQQAAASIEEMRRQVLEAKERERRLWQQIDALNGTIAGLQQALLTHQPPAPATEPVPAQAAQPVTVADTPAPGLVTAIKRRLRYWVS